MSPPHRRQAGSSRGSSSRNNRSLSVTEASFQGLSISEAASSSYLPVPSSYGSPDQRQHLGQGGNYYPSGYDQSIYEPPLSYPGLSPTLETPVQYAHSLPSEIISSTRTSSSFGQPDMSSYPSNYPSIPYHGGSSSQGYTNPGQITNCSMSGPPEHTAPIMPFPPYGRSRESARQRRQHKPRREEKWRMRRTMLPSPSEVEGEISSIDFFPAAPPTSYTSTPVTYIDSASSNYGASMPSAPYQTYPTQYTSPRTGLDDYNRVPITAPHTATPPPRYNNNHAPGKDNSPPHRPLEPRLVQSAGKHQCFDHGCNGREFSTSSNLLRHKREKSGNSAKAECNKCGAVFTRKTARDGHMQHEKCKPRSGH